MQNTDTEPHSTQDIHSVYVMARREERQAEAVCGNSASKVEPCQHLQKPKLSLRHPVRLINQLATSASALKSSHQPAPYLSIYSLFKPVRLSSAIQIKRPSGRECRANCRCSIFKVGFGPESSLGLEATTVSSQRLNHATQYSVAPFPLPDPYFYSKSVMFLVIKGTA